MIKSSEVLECCDNNYETDVIILPMIKGTVTVDPNMIIYCWRASRMVRYHGGTSSILYMRPSSTWTEWARWEEGIKRQIPRRNIDLVYKRIQTRLQHEMVTWCHQIKAEVYLQPVKIMYDYMLRQCAISCIYPADIWCYGVTSSKSENRGAQLAILPLCSWPGLTSFSWLPFRLTFRLLPSSMSPALFILL